MKEEKLDQQIASSIRKKLKEGSLPYEIGAWESFQRQRLAKRRSKTIIWFSGIAASLLGLFVVGQILFNGGVEQAVTDQTALLGAEDKIEDRLPIGPAEESHHDAAAEEEKPDPAVLPEKRISIPSRHDKDDVLQRTAAKEGYGSTSDRIIAEADRKEQNTIELQDSTVGKGEELKTQVKVPSPITNPDLSSAIATLAMKDSIAADLDKKEVLIAQVEPTEKAESENVEAWEKVEEMNFPEIPKQSAQVAWGMGVAPSFGSVQQSNLVSNASALAVGVMVDIELPSKFTLGSGLGVNYLNQTNETALPNTAMGFASDQTARLDVRQMQIEMPVFFRYPITRSKSISLQAGFSNFYAVNQRADKETSYMTNVPVLDQASSLNSFKLMSQEVVFQEPVPATQNRFYPLATVNFGVNLRVHESKKLNYIIMPFYNYQLTPIDGFGESLGFFGASMKLSFGSIKD